jgi:hypothetical protein
MRDNRTKDQNEPHVVQIPLSTEVRY